MKINNLDYKVKDSSPYIVAFDNAYKGDRNAEAFINFILEFKEELTEEEKKYMKEKIKDKNIDENMWKKLFEELN